MGVQKKTRKFAQVKRAIGLRDSRLFVIMPFLNKASANCGLTGRRTRRRMTKKTTKRKMTLLEKCMYSYILLENIDPDVSNLTVLPRPQVSSALFFQYNTALAPPYSILVDTNFLSHTIQHKLEVIPSMMDCLYAKCIPIVTDCVLAELEKLGQKYRLALRIAKDPRFERIKCDHKGTYADDCLVDRVIKHRVYIVATNDRDLKRRIR